MRSGKWRKALFIVSTRELTYYSVTTLARSPIYSQKSTICSAFTLEVLSFAAISRPYTRFHLR